MTGSILENRFPMVSVVIATYNTAKYLPEAVRSVLLQTYNNYEIIVVDDGSTDGTDEVMEQFQSEEKVHYYVLKHGGQAKTKNAGIMASKGDFVAFLDADDFWTIDKIEKQLPCFNRNDNIGIVYTNLTVLDQDGGNRTSSDRKYYNGKITEPLLMDNFVTGMTSMVRRECFDVCGLFDETLPMGIDYDLWLRLSTKYDFYYLNESTYVYRLWEGQLSKDYKTRMECSIRILNKFFNDFPDIVSLKVMNKAWAQNYIGRGQCDEIDLKRMEAFHHYVRALKFNPMFVTAWRCILKLILKYMALRWR